LVLDGWFRGWGSFPAYSLGQCGFIVRSMLGLPGTVSSRKPVPALLAAVFTRRALGSAPGFTDRPD